MSGQWADLGVTRWGPQLPIWHRPHCRLPAPGGGGVDSTVVACQPKAAAYTWIFNELSQPALATTARCWLGVSRVDDRPNEGCKYLGCARAVCTLDVQLVHFWPASNFRVRLGGGAGKVCQLCSVLGSLIFASASNQAIT